VRLAYSTGKGATLTLDGCVQWWQHADPSSPATSVGISLHRRVGRAAAADQGDRGAGVVCAPCYPPPPPFPEELHDPSAPGGPRAGRNTRRVPGNAAAG
jgi:hypothetical protein